MVIFARRRRFGLAGLVAAGAIALGCGGQGEATIDTPPETDAAADAPIEAAPDARLDASPDVGVDAGTEADAAEAGCASPPPDASLVDGLELGLPSVDVPVAPPVVTAQVDETPVGDHLPFQVGVLTFPDAQHPGGRNAQAVVHLLEPVGVPYAVTKSPLLALVHDMVVVFPDASDQTFDSNATAQVRQWVQGGGTLVVRESPSQLLKSLGGLSSSQLVKAHSSVTLTDEGKARFPSLDQPEEQTIPLGGDASAHLNTWELVLDPSVTTTKVLATFDGDPTKPAIVENTVQKGRVYTIGVDYRDVVLRNQLGHSIEAARHYVNAFEPATDTWALMLRDLYDARARFGVRLHEAPGATRAALLVTHDLDWGPSYDNAVAYAEEEALHGAHATYFVHTKYVSDAQDVAFFDGTRGAQLASIVLAGGSVGSHTVAHSPVLHGFPVGDGTEAYPAYRPYDVDVHTTTGGTLFGELRVSKSLIDAALAGACSPHETVSFRAGNLDFHANLPETMERLGYAIDSTRAVGEVLGAFPFRMMTDWGDPDSPARQADTSVFELPVSIEDQAAPRLDDRTSDALRIVAANADNGAPTVLLVHPNVLDWKLEAERTLLGNLPPGVVATSLDAYGAFVRARASARIASVDYDTSQGTVTIRVTAGLPIDDLSLRVGDTITGVASPASAHLVVVQVTGKPDEHVVTLPALAAGESITVVATYPPP